MLDQEILRGGIWEYEEDKDGGDTVEGKHVDALHAQDEYLCGFSGGEDKSIERKKGIQPSARQHLYVKTLRPSWSIRRDCQLILMSRTRQSV